MKLKEQGELIIGGLLLTRKECVTRDTNVELQPEGFHDDLSLHIAKKAAFKLTCDVVWYNTEVDGVERL